MSDVQSQEPGEGWRGELTAGAVCALGGLAFLIGGLGGVESRNPPQFDDMWLLSWGLSLAAMICALIYSRLKGNRAAAIFAIALALLGSLFPTQSYFGNYHTYPWIAVILLAGLCIAGGLTCRLPLLSILTIGFLFFWLHPALQSPVADLPQSKESGGLICKLTALDSFELSDAGGRDMSRVVQWVELTAHSGPLIGIECWHPEAIDGGVRDIPRGKTLRMTANVFKPSWVRSCDLSIIVHRLLSQPTVAITIPLNHLPTGPVEAAANGYQLAASDIGWSPTKDTLLATISFSGFDYSGTRGGEFVILDDLGNVLP